ncbi:MAG: DUF1329 domain-containing protein [Thermodesulfobacteriota bacterium]|nr:DUF1329 domain-containing protein [Thermodesulfobacteriota bacterium]
MKRTFLIFLILCICTHDLSRAKEIKPGIVINEGNYTEYLPELKKLLTPGYLTDIIMALKNGWITFPVVEKKNYPPAEHFHRATLNNVGRYKVARDNRLIGKPSWKAGLPFLPPRTAAEVAWNVYKRREYGDQMSYYAPFLLFDLKTNCPDGEIVYMDTL